MPTGARAASPARDGTVGFYAFMRDVLETEHGGWALPKTPRRWSSRCSATSSSTGGSTASTTRQIRRALGMATNHRHSQPPEAPPPPARCRDGLNRDSADCCRPARATGPVDLACPPSGFSRQPRGVAGKLIVPRRPSPLAPDRRAAAVTVDTGERCAVVPKEHPAADPARHVEQLYRSRGGYPPVRPADCQWGGGDRHVGAPAPSGCRGSPFGNPRVPFSSDSAAVKRRDPDRSLDSRSRLLSLRGMSDFSSGRS